MKRCINLDWLEVYCHESEQNYPQNADYYRHLGFYVEEREYGTRIYDEMFTIFDEQMQPAIEIRRKPTSIKKHSEKSILHPRSCHIRFNNRYCYFENSALIMLEFIQKVGLEFVNISRVDICLDFEKFDSGDEPEKFIRRYMEHKYSKINQSDVRAVGKDEWAGLNFNSLHWGSKTSAISTKLYNKTKEIKEHSNKGGKPYKPYIPQSWCNCNLIDNFTYMTKTKADGTTYTPQIWRIEFTISSKVKGWVELRNHHRQRNNEPKFLSYRNTLDVYADEKKLIHLFSALVHQYFFFRYYEEGKRKYDCREKKLFNFDEDNDTICKPERPLTSSKEQSYYGKLLMLLKDYYIRAYDDETKDAINKIVKKLEEQYNREFLDKPFDKHLQILLQQLMSGRCNKSEIEQEIKFINTLEKTAGKIY